jgi:hypothetical protein
MATTQTFRDKLDFLVRLTGRGETELVAEAVREGVDELYRRQVTDAYLAGELSREETVTALGEDAVTTLDETLRAVEQDVRWGLRRE